jgi:hypothetical protein
MNYFKRPFSLSVAPTYKSKLQTSLDIRRIIYNTVKILSPNIKFSVDIEVKEFVALYNVIRTSCFASAMGINTVLCVSNWL